MSIPLPSTGVHVSLAPPKEKIVGKSTGPLRFEEPLPLDGSTGRTTQYNQCSTITVVLAVDTGLVRKLPSMTEGRKRRSMKGTFDFAGADEP